MKRYEQIPHTADIAAKIYGKTIPELFENAAYAMFDMMVDLKEVKDEEAVTLKVEAPDNETLLISWLNELLYYSYSHKILFYEFSVVSLEDNKLTAMAVGKSVGKEIKQINKEIKAATYHDLEIKKISKGYEVTVVFDV